LRESSATDHGIDADQQRRNHEEGLDPSLDERSAKRRPRIALLARMVVHMSRPTDTDLVNGSVVPVQQQVDNDVRTENEPGAR
jgi:hypothetical protein